MKSLGETSTKVTHCSDTKTRHVLLVSLVTLGDMLWDRNWFLMRCSSSAKFAEVIRANRSEHFSFLSPFVPFPLQTLHVLSLFSFLLFDCLP